MLSVIDGIDGYVGWIEEVGVYFSRHGVLSTLLPEIGGGNLDRFLVEFKRLTTDAAGSKLG